MLIESPAKPAPLIKAIEKKTTAAQHKRRKREFPIFFQAHLLDNHISIRYTSI